MSLNNPVPAETSEIRLPDGTLINVEKSSIQNKHSTTATMLILGSVFDSEFGTYESLCVKRHCFSELTSFAPKEGGSLGWC